MYFFQYYLNLFYYLPWALPVAVHKLIAPVSAKTKCKILLTSHFAVHNVLAGVGGVFVNAQLNGSKISGLEVSGELDDDDVLSQYYWNSSVVSHGWVVFRTQNGKAFMCHLVGVPGKLQVRVEKTIWNPGDRTVNNLTVSKLYISFPFALDSFIEKKTDLEKIEG